MIALRGGGRTTTAYEVKILRRLMLNDLIVMSCRLAIWCFILIGEDRHLIELEINRGIVGVGPIATAAVNQVL